MRHGETEWNRAKRFQGQLDSPLSPQGLQQVQALSEQLQSIDFAAIYASDLPRAHQTARIIAGAQSASIITDRRLRERNYGIFEGLTLPEVQEKYPAVYQQFQQSPFEAYIPGAETALAFANRAYTCLTELALHHANQRFLVVTHGGVIGRFLRMVLGIPLNMPRRFRIANATINMFTHHQHHWRLDVLGALSHCPAPDDPTGEAADNGG